MVKAMCDYLVEKPHLYLDEVALRLYEDFGKEVTECSTLGGKTGVGGFALFLCFPSFTPRRAKLL
jgi:hypothetical protein